MNPQLLSGTALGGVYDPTPAGTGNPVLDQILANNPTSNSPLLDQILQNTPGVHQNVPGHTINTLPQTQNPGTSVAVRKAPLEGTVEGGSSGLMGPGIAAAGGLVGLTANAPNTDQGIYNNANSFNDWFNKTRIGQGLNWAMGGRTTPQYGGPQAQPYPQTQPDTSSQVGKPPPPIDIPPLTVDGTKLPPFNRGPIPYSTPQNATAPVAQRRPGAPNLGYGVPQQQAAAPQAPSSMFTTIDRPNADISGGPTRGGWLSASYDPSTGSNRGAREPGGPARMGALDLSGLFSHPAVAQAAAQHPAVQGALAHNIARGQVPAAVPTAQAPVIQQQWSLPQVRPRGASAVAPTYRNPAYGQGANVGLGN